VWYDAHENFLVLLELSTLFQDMFEIQVTARLATEMWTAFLLYQILFLQSRNCPVSDLDEKSEARNWNALEQPTRRK
jgi:hypothetical protein